MNTPNELYEELKCYARYHRSYEQHTMYKPYADHLCCEFCKYAKKYTIDEFIHTASSTVLTSIWWGYKWVYTHTLLIPVNSDVSSLYSDNIFSVKIKQIDNNLQCTFTKEIVMYKYEKIVVFLVVMMIFLGLLFVIGVVQYTV